MSERRVLVVLGQSAGGIARHVAQITAALDGRKGLRVDIAGPTDLPIKMPKPVMELAIPSGPLGHRRARALLRRMVVDGGYDIVHAHGLRAGMDAGGAARRDAVVFVTIHNLVRPEIAGRVAAIFYRLAEPLAVLLTHRTFAVSEEIAQHLRRRTPRAAHKIEVLHLGIGDAPPVTRSRADVRGELGTNDVKMVVTAARLAPQKALPVMLEALDRLPDDVVLVVVGRGPLEDALKDEARRLNLDGRVRWLGWRDDVADIIAAADVFCLSSDWEGVPLAAQEAILLGAPIVGTDVGGMSELVRDGESGRLVQRGDSSALARALSEVLGSKARADQYVARARAGLVESFSTDAMLARLETAYLEGR